MELFEQFLLGGGVELRQQLNRATFPERRLNRFERLASPNRGGAEDEVWADFPPPHVLGDPLRRTLASRRERTVDVGECRIRPIRLSVTKQDESSHLVTVSGAAHPARGAAPLPDLYFVILSK